MKVVIPGGSGQVGTILARAFQGDGHEVVVLSRTARKASWAVVTWDAIIARFMELALGQAQRAIAKGQTPFGAVVVDRSGQLIGEGHNAVRSDLDPAAHGEVVAIRDAWRRVGAWQMLTGGTLYSSCEPCLLCSFVITQIAFSRVVFAARGTDVPTYKPLLGADLAKAAAWVNAQPDWAPLEVVGDFMRERALEVIAAFPWAQAQTRTALERSS